MSYSCKYCHKEFQESYQVAAHTSMCKLNPNYNLYRGKETTEEIKNKNKNTRLKNDPYRCERKVFNFICKKCGKPYTLILTQSQYDKGKYKKYCSRTCANSRCLSEEHKKHISEGVKTSEKFKNNNKNAIYKHIKHEESRLKYEKSEEYLLSLTRNCIICQKPINIYSIQDGHIKYISKKYCCEDCKRKGISIQNKNKCGGYRENSVRSYKSGIYHNIHCDSSWELAFIIWNEEHGHIIERNYEARIYEYNGEIKKFYPDFLVDKKELVEIKGINDDIAKAKLLYNQDVKFLYRKDIKKFIDYVKEKYGNNFINLYEKHDKIRGIGSVATAPHCL